MPTPKETCDIACKYAGLRRDVGSGLCTRWNRACIACKRNSIHIYTNIAYLFACMYLARAIEHLWLITTIYKLSTAQCFSYFLMYCLCLARRISVSTRAQVQSLLTTNQQRTQISILRLSIKSLYSFYRMFWVNPERERTTEFNIYRGRDLNPQLLDINKLNSRRGHKTLIRMFRNLPHA